MTWPCEPATGLREDRGHRVCSATYGTYFDSTWVCRVIP